MKGNTRCYYDVLEHIPLTGTFIINDLPKDAGINGSILRKMANHGFLDRIKRTQSPGGGRDRIWVWSATDKMRAVMARR